ncbi:MAG TPA: DUF4337 domain-containing protein [Allosphingosinicella sp.]|nr:DUF4337 domain-containing protein [Allosphingosinicella sp.]
MDSADAAELIAEIHEDRAEQEQSERFRNRAALMIALLAATLAIGGLGGGNATDEMIFNNIRASDTWAFFQAKNMRQTLYEVAAEEIETALASPAISAEERTRLERRLADYRATVARYESEPDPEAPNDPTRGEGKTQLRAQAEAFEAARERASEQDGNFDMAEVLLQLALVLGSVAILAVNRPILILAGLLGLAGGALTANGFLLLAAMPF